jgi:amino acid transporter
MHNRVSSDACFGNAILNIMHSGNHTSIRRSFAYGIGLAALVALASIVRALALGNEALVLFDISGTAFAFILFAIAFLITRKQERKHKA